MCLCICLTIRLQRWAPTVQSHDDGCESQSAFHTVFPNGLQDIVREVDVQVTQEHYAVTVLEITFYTITSVGGSVQQVKCLEKMCKYVTYA